MSSKTGWMAVSERSTSATCSGLIPAPYLPARRRGPGTDSRLSDWRNGLPARSPRSYPRRAGGNTPRILRTGAGRAAAVALRPQPAEAVTVVAMAQAPTLAWPFVGRGLEVDRFVDALADPGVDVFAVLGPPGVGKTRLATACEQAAGALGASTVRVTGRHGTGVPLAAMAHLLPPRLDLPDPGSATSVDALALMHTIIRRFVGPSGGQDRRAGAPRRVLLVEDADLLDPLSATLVGHLVSTGAVFLLATVRGNGESADALASLWRGDRAVRVELGSLDRSQVETVLHLALGGPVDAHTSVAYWIYSDGKPLGLRELVLDALERGVLVESGGVWRLTGSLVGGGRTEALAASRLRGLDERELELLELLAVAHELGLADMEARYPPDMLERLEERGLVAVRSDGRRLRLSVAHPLYEQAIRGGLSALRARRRRRTVIEILESHGLRRREDRITSAMLRLDNNEPADPALLLRAAWLAGHARDYAQAERLARAAHAVAPTTTSARLWAEALHELGRFGESLAVLDAVGPDGPDDPGERLALGLARANTLYWGLGRPDEALAVLARLAADPELAGQHREVEVQRATLAGYLGEIGLAGAVLAAVARDQDPATVGLVRHTIELLAGQAEAALGTAQDAYAASVSASGGGSPHPGIHLVNVVTALVELGRFEAAASLVGPLYDEAAVEHQDAVQRWWPAAGWRCSGGPRWPAATSSWTAASSGRRNDGSGRRPSRAAARCCPGRSDSGSAGWRSRPGCAGTRLPPRPRSSGWTRSPATRGAPGTSATSGAAPGRRPPAATSRPGARCCWPPPTGPGAPAGCCWRCTPGTTGCGWAGPATGCSGSRSWPRWSGPRSPGWPARMPVRSGWPTRPGWKRWPRTWPRPATCCTPPRLPSRRPPCSVASSSGAGRSPATTGPRCCAAGARSPAPRCWPRPSTWSRSAAGSTRSRCWWPRGRRTRRSEERRVGKVCRARWAAC